MNRLGTLENFRHSFMILLIIFLVVSMASSQNWPQWRGPTDNNLAAPGNYPTNFSSSENVLWSAELPGKGSSTPIVITDRIFITSGIGEDEEGEDGVLCFDWSGKPIWQTKLGKQVPGKHPRGSGSCPSLVTDGRHIFAYFKSTTLAALDLDGNIIWIKNLEKQYGKISMYWDLGTSPVLIDDKLVVAVMHEGSSYLLALDKMNGKVVWKVDRNYQCAEETAQSYTTPLVITENKQKTLVVWGADHLTGHNAVNGELLWQSGGFNPQNKIYWRTIASPAVSNGIAVVPYGRGKHLAGIKIGGSGDIKKTARLWEKKGIGTDVATPVAIDGKVYIVSFKGKIWYLDIMTGNELWQDRLPRGGGMFYSSPILAGNKLYICREEGDVYVCEVNPDGMQVLNQTQFDDYFVATPVLIRDRILLRGEKNLYCIGN
jgi:outer membrane protein assembly factor BamB